MKKIISLILAIAMTMSMGALCFAENVQEDEFYTQAQILTYNPETNDFDVSYMPVSELDSSVARTPKNFKFTFNQTINSSTTGNFLMNTTTYDGNPDTAYLLEDDDTICIRLDKKPSGTLYFQSYHYLDGYKLGPTGTIKNQVTVISGFSKAFNLLGVCKLQLRTSSGSQTISGTVTEN